MASLICDRESGNFKIKFWHDGRQFKWSLRHNNAVLAEETAARVQRTLRDLDEGRLVLPEGADLIEFVKTDGGRTAPLKAPEKPLTLGQLFCLYPEKLTEGAKKKNSLETELIHGRHLVSVLGAERTLASLAAPGGMQEYIDKRAKEKWRGQAIRGRTIKKEMDTLRLVWRWAYSNGLTKIACPKEQTSKLVFPSGREKPPFQTWEEIERKIARGGLSQHEQEEMWECLFLDLDQVKDVLNYVRDHAQERWIYHALLFVAHTGARRSEMIRSHVEDFDWDEGIVRIREYKRKRSTMTYRNVPMSTQLREAFEAYFKDQHTGRFSIAIDPKTAEIEVAQGDVEGYVAWAVKKATDSFRQVFKGSKWQVLHGYHTFRHSIVSNMARNGIDQRLIDGIVGHETEAMQRRYRHLFPRDKQDVIKRLFG